MADWGTRDWRGVGGAEWAVAEGAWCIPIRIAPPPKAAVSAAAEDNDA